MALSNIEAIRRLGPVRPPLPPALLVELQPLLKDGQWIPACIVAEIAKKHHVQFSSVGEALGLAESDEAAFVCIPTQETPLEAPDEALAAAEPGLSHVLVIRTTINAWRRAHKKPGPKASQENTQLELAM